MFWNHHNIFKVWLCQGNISRTFFFRSNVSIIPTLSSMVEWGIRTAGHIFIPFHRPENYYPIFSSIHLKGHVKYCHHLTSVVRPSANFYPIIFLFETTIPFENKLGRNVPRIVIFFATIKYSTWPPWLAKIAKIFLSNTIKLIDTKLHMKDHVQFFFWWSLIHYVHL